jgi:hypothetical protein
MHATMTHAQVNDDERRPWRPTVFRCQGTRWICVPYPACRAGESLVRKPRPTRVIGRAAATCCLSVEVGVIQQTVQERSPVALHRYR